MPHVERNVVERHDARDVRPGLHHAERGVVEERIKEDRQSGIRSGVNGTPTFFVNGVRFDGSPDYGSLLVALESELALRSV